MRNVLIVSLMLVGLTGFANTGDQAGAPAHKDQAEHADKKADANKPAEAAKKKEEKKKK